MNFSICIPNFNYEQYVGLTLESVVKQTLPPFEILVTDNASTDKSAEVIKSYAEKHTNITLKVNSTNIGFAGNVDEVGRMASGDWMIMLSSDDVMKKDALTVYKKFIQLIPNTEQFVFCSTFEKIDSNGKFIEYISPSQSSIWFRSDIDPELSMQMGFDIYKVSAPEMLKRCLTRFLNPFNFASTCYKKTTYEKVGGYGGGRLYNPDKWFHWKIMMELDYVYYIDIPLFQYRWHQNNQVSQQQQNQILKYWLDEYRNCFEISKQMLVKAGLNEHNIMRSCIRHSFLAYSFKFIKEYQYLMAFRICLMAFSIYPMVCIRALKFYLLLLLLLMGPIGSLMANLVKK